MRTTLLMLLATTALASAQIVTVSGKKVDLTPLSAWMTNQQGDRPLKHWKAINIYEIKGEVSVWKKCAIGGEAGEQDVLLANVPAPIQAFLNTIKDKADANEREEAAVEQEDARIRAARAAVPTDTSADGSGSIRIQEYNRQLNLDEERLIVRQKALELAKEDYRTTLKEAGDKSQTFAMFTGSKYNGLEVWDCGKR